MFILELLAGILGQLALDLVFMSIIEFSFQSIYQQFRPAREATWWVAAPGLLIVGGLVGIGSAFVMQERVIRGIGIPGLSLLIAPLAAAVGVWAIARFVLEPNGIEPSALFTWWGGAVFAFAAAAMRLIGIS